MLLQIAEKFYPAFYKCVTDHLLFKDLNKKCSMIVGLELANYVLAHLTGSTVKNNVVDFNVNLQTLAQKEKSIAKYLSGCVFGTLYRRIRCSDHHRSIMNIQSLSILYAGKSEANETNPDDRLINAKNKGGLWTVSQDVFEMFLIVESYFRARTEKKILRKINCKEMVADLVKHCRILMFYNKIRNASVEKVPKEIAINLLEHIIELYLRARTFSLVKQKKEIFKLEAKKKKLNSLQKSIKKALPVLNLVIDQFWKKRKSYFYSYKHETKLYFGSNTTHFLCRFMFVIVMCGCTKQAEYTIFFVDLCLLLSCVGVPSRQSIPFSL